MARLRKFEVHAGDEVHIVSGPNGGISGKIKDICDDGQYIVSYGEARFEAGNKLLWTSDITAVVNEHDIVPRNRPGGAG